MSNFQVVYLTGPPATGKSTLARLLASRMAGLRVFHYSSLLAAHINAKNSASLVEDDLRARSAKVITPDDVHAVDEWLISEVTELRQHSHVVIDSHAVTKEEYGFRVTPFSYGKLRALAPTAVCLTYAEADEIIARISACSGGRPMVTQFQADFHLFLQSQVALAYSLELGVPLYVFDTTSSVDQAVDKIIALLER